MKKVSVIIPAYNSELFIAETLDNMLRQSLDDIEILVVNDGSTDGTVDIVKSYQSKYDNIVLVNQQNGGVSSARNHGLSVATGEYVLFHDADDLISDTTLEAFYNRAKQTDADILIGRIRNFSGDEYSKYNPIADTLASMDCIDNFDKTLLWNFLVGNKFYRRERLVESAVTFPPYRYSEEGAFFMSYVYTGAKIAGCMGAEAYYRRHTESEGLSVSQTVTKSLAQSFCDSLNMIYDGADKALSNCDDSVKNDYLEEILYKKAFVLSSQFYRPLWRGDDECLEFCANEISDIYSMLTGERKQKLASDNCDLKMECLAKTKHDVIANSSVTIIIKPSVKNADLLLNQLYNQFLPFFEVIVPQSLADSGAISECFLNMPNLHILQNKGYMKRAKKVSKVFRVVFGKNVNLDVRSLRLAFKLGAKLPLFITRSFYSLMSKSINFVLIKKIIK